MNWLAILCAGAAYWVLGSVWYAMLFGRIWAAEQKGGLEHVRPSGREMAGKMVGTFICNFVAAAVMAYLIKGIGITDLNHALRLGAAVGVGFAGTALTLNSIWESKSTVAWAIDAGYNLVGALLLAVILVSWP
jgi:hypothetical protein